MRFIVFALPRSRSKWLSVFLTYRDWRCEHEGLMLCDTLAEVRAWLARPCTGTVETAAAPLWKLLEGCAPGVRVVTLRRPIPAVLASLRTTGLRFDWARVHRVLENTERQLDTIEAALPDVLAVRFAELEDEATCARVFEHCLPYRHDPAWWRQLALQNIQVDMRQMQRTVARRQHRLHDLTGQALRA
jgi:hypothetical protein